MNINLIILLLPSIYCIHKKVDNQLRPAFEKINEDALKYNQIGANLAWESAICPGNIHLSQKISAYEKRMLRWQRTTCIKLKTAYNERHMTLDWQKRQTYLLCKGPIYKLDETIKFNDLSEQLQAIYYESEVCIPIVKKLDETNLEEIEEAIFKFILAVSKNAESVENDPVALAAEIAINDYSSVEKVDVICLKEEETFQKLMQFSRKEIVLRWLWMVWRDKVGPSQKIPYTQLIEVENKAARRNGYTDIGQCWREDMEIPNLRELSHKLYREIKPMYSLLHGVTRFFLRRKYGDIVPQNGLIPAHLLGDLWSQNWEHLSDLIVHKTIDLEERMAEQKWSVIKMIKNAEDFYRSLGLPELPDSFWEKSVLSRRTYDSARCHGTAANMFREGDYRLLYCSGISPEDFYVIHHELGHIQYYMAYEHQPALFQQANPAFHESIGDAIMYGVMTPQHLHRLGLINDSLLYTMGNESCDHALGSKVDKAGHIIDDFGVDTNVLNVSSDILLLFKTALNKIPQIPFAMLMEEYRWRLFESDIKIHNMNSEFWELATKLQGIAPPNDRDERFFDAGARFHVPDNTPYIRYFISSFLQHQLFESLCKVSVFGRRDVKEDLPSSIPMHRCDIYGSKAAGKLLKDLMSRGHSQHWRDILHETIGKDHLSVLPIKRYYRPLFTFLTNLVNKYRIPIGW